MESMHLSCQSCDVHMYLKKTRYRFLLALGFYLFAILDDAISSRLVIDKEKYQRGDYRLNYHHIQRSNFVSNVR